MRKYRIHLDSPTGLWLARLAIAIAIVPGPGWGQQPLWQRLIDEGNQALARGAIFEAEACYLRALQVADQFAPQDLRRATTQRNLAQTLMLQGRFEPADSLYRLAITTATRALETGHPYVLSLQEERAQLRQAMQEAARPEVSPEQPPSSIKDIILSSAEWLGRRSALQLGTILPLGGELGNSHDGGLSYGLGLHTRLVSLGALAVGLGIEHVITTLPAIHATDAPFRLHGTTVALAPALGPIALNLGAGAYSIGADHQPEIKPGLVGGLRLAVTGRTARPGQVGLKTTIYARGIHLPDIAPAAEGPVTLLQAGFDVGWQW
ncbi:MAG: tetratricopeptide repeat protein [Candidatus Neomarinimicrobiota bacterium]